MQAVSLLLAISMDVGDVYKDLFSRCDFLVLRAIKIVLNPSYLCLLKTNLQLLHEMNRFVSEPFFATGLNAYVLGKNLFFC